MNDAALSVHSVSLSTCRYLGLFATQEEAAMAYDRESVAQRGHEAETNFSLDLYADLLDHGSQPTPRCVARPVLSNHVFVSCYSCICKCLWHAATATWSVHKQWHEVQSLSA